MGFYTKFVITVALLLVGMASGWVARHRGWVPEYVARKLMTLVAVFGYSTIGMLTVWTTPLRVEDIWLPLLGAVLMVVLTGVGIVAGKLLLRDRQ
ncbi:MAG: hypothetical protein ACLFV7_08175, partial [Phycisphaerae bacterium]